MVEISECDDLRCTFQESVCECLKRDYDPARIKHFAVPLISRGYVKVNASVHLLGSTGLKYF